jgi:hypothetical protein
MIKAFAGLTFSKARRTTRQPLRHLPSIEALEERWLLDGRVNVGVLGGMVNSDPLNPQGEPTSIIAVGTALAAALLYIPPVGPGGGPGVPPGSEDPAGFLPGLAPPLPISPSIGAEATAPGPISMPLMEVPLETLPPQDLFEFGNFSLPTEYAWEIFSTIG